MSIIELKPRSAGASRMTADGQQEPSDPTEPSLAMLMATIEEMDRGIKLMIDVIAEQDKRLRYLELQERKAQRRNVPVIVNQLGRPVKSAGN